MAPTTALGISRLFSVTGLVVVITGGGSGLGAMMAKTLALNGAAKVYIVGRRRAALDAVVADVAATAPAVPAGTIVPLTGDVTSKDSLAALAEHVRADAGYVDVLIANAGALGPTVSGFDAPANGGNGTLAEFQAFAWEQSADEFTATYALNCTAAYFTAIAFLTLLDAGNARRRGVPGAPDSQIIVTSSIAGYLRKIVTGFAYTSSKAAATHLVKGLSSFLAPWGIRVNAFAPGFFPSEMTEELLRTKAERVPAGREGETDIWKMSTDNVPAGRAGSEEDVAGTVLWLVSRAGGYINGNVVVMDGGRLSLMPSTY